MNNLPSIVPFDELQRMGMAIAKSGLFGAKSPEQAIALMLIAQAEGRHPAAAAQDYDIIQGRAAKKAEAMVRDFIAANGKIEWHALTDEVADATFSHPSGGTVRIHWDLARAQRAGLAGKDNWKKWPRAMLRCRCVSEGCKTIYPVSTSSMHTPEEVSDMDLPRDVTRSSSAEKLTQIEAAKAELIPGLSPPQTPQQFFDETMAPGPHGSVMVETMIKMLRERGHEEHALKLMELLACYKP